MKITQKPSAEVQELFLEAQKLNKVTDDPKSKFEARGLYIKIKNKLESDKDSFDKDSLDYRILVSSIDYYLAGNYTTTGELSEGQKKFISALKNFTEEELLLGEVIILSVSIYNELGLLWINQENQNDARITPAFKNFKTAEKLYCEFTQSSEPVPMLIEDHFLDNEAGEEESKTALEKLYTQTLCYLGQAYKQLDQSKESASCLLRTLKRQLGIGDYSPAVWAINCACLSQYFVSEAQFYEARHCLVCADHVLNQIQQLKDEGEQNPEYVENRTQIARCWVKYYLALLEFSKNWVREKDPEPQVHGFRQQDDSTFIVVEEGFPLLMEVESIEDSVPVKYITTSEQAKKAFVLGKQQADHVQEFLVTHSHVTECVEINQDISRLYFHTVHFEESDEIKCRMHKRRVDLLLATVKELSPQNYLDFYQQLNYEIAETYSTMMDLKYAIASKDTSKLSEKTKKKINLLCKSSMKHFNNFIDTVKVNNKLPDKYGVDIERAALTSHFYIARLWSKILHSTNDERLANLRKSLEVYKYVVKYAKTHPGCKESIQEELMVCVDMVEVLPRSLDKIVAQMNAGLV